MDKAADLLPILDAVLQVVLTVAGPVLAALAARWLKANVDAKYREEMRLVARGAFWAVERFSREGSIKSADKLARALKLLEEELGRPLKPKEASQAAGIFRALAEREKHHPGVPGIVRRRAGRG